MRGGEGVRAAWTTGGSPAWTGAASSARRTALLRMEDRVFTVVVWNWWLKIFV